ncbi:MULTISPECIES: hypothetical protein [unclassified Novosphingobium]|uniref:hypothetical protein n=1 Tax=unclassified Novosphingobium TaxID=2644732 RepID=UPI001620DABA|nr:MULTISPECIES: hypothetical protein [unclassified Novosphingobium]MBB3357037.1 hypothetical protein [Novosphingobium sp. BK256]MBB3373438.1 hypothetical protein [Novosphingobium sp. BK280]MBB3377807.1 hypothetical protein [Novosphingobium sp. BK258]MBB3418782.1 hypothetical protein [Novosphingobium sp. BK267]MBB3450383.1 hypothetical protein [Novosphingobium sp. BK352]
MADHFVQGAFAFICSTSEAALIEEAWQLAADLMGDFETSPVSDELLEVFPPTIEGKPLSGFTSIFDDANFPDFGADIRVQNSAEDTQVCTVSIFGTTDFQPWPIAGLIQRCCPASLAKTPVGFDWSYSCTRPYLDSFGGGWCAVFPDRIEIETTKEAVPRALDAAIAMSRRDGWADDPAHPVEDWKTEVTNDDTRRGFRGWIEGRVEMLAGAPGIAGVVSPVQRRRDPVRIRATDRLGNVAYIHREADRPIQAHRRWRGVGGEGMAGPRRIGPFHRRIPHGNACPAHRRVPGFRRV